MKYETAFWAAIVLFGVWAKDAEHLSDLILSGVWLLFAISILFASFHE